MQLYHGTTLAGAYFIATAPQREIYVTKTPELAARYANAQVTRIVTAAFEPLVEGAAIVEFECAKTLEFFRRPSDHNTLDLVEKVMRIEDLKIVKIIIRPSAYVARGVSRGLWTDSTIRDSRHYDHAAILRALRADSRIEEKDFR